MLHFATFLVTFCSEIAREAVRSLLSMVNKTGAQDPQRLTRRERTVLLTIIAFAVVLRLVYHFEMRGNVLVEQLQLDELFHDRWAQSVASGEVVGEAVFFRAPLYPYAVGLVYGIFGNVPEVVRVLQHLLGAGSVFLIYILGRFLFGVRPAVAASLLGASYAVLIFFEGRLLFDFPLTFLVLLWLTLVVLFADRQTWEWYALFGFLYGLICVMRPTFLVLAIPLFGYIVWRHLRGRTGFMRCASALVMAFLVPVLLVTVRNALVGGDFVLIASQGGINFYIGNNPGSDGMTSSVPEAGGIAWENRHVEYLAEQALGYPPDPSEVSTYWYGKAWNFIRDKPLEFLQLLVKKFYLFCSHIEIANNLSYYWFERASFVLKTLPVGFWLVGPLGLAGAAMGWKEPRARLLILFFLLYTIVTIAFFVTDRFRLPVIPLLCIFTGYLIYQVFVDLRTRRWRLLAAIGTFTAAGALVVNTNFVSLRPDLGSGEKSMLARAALESGDFAKAAELSERVVSLDPENSGAHVNRGVALWMMGKTREAASAFQAGARGNPYLASLNLAHLFFNMQAMDSAGIYANHAINARPSAPGGYIIAAKIFLVQQNVHRARETLLQGYTVCREDFVYGEYLLGGIHFQQGNVRAADSLYRRVLGRIIHLREPRYAIESEKVQFGEDLPTLYAKTLHALGRVFAANERLDSSEVYLRRAANLLPTKADVWADWGVCLFRLNRLEEADTVMSRAIAVEKNNPAIWLNYALLLARKGDGDAAQRAVSIALALKPGFREAQELRKILTSRE